MSSDDINLSSFTNGGYADPTQWGLEFTATVEDVSIGQNANGQYIKVIIRNVKTGELARIYYSPFWFAELAKVATTAKSLQGNTYKFKLLVKKTRSNLTVSKYLPIAQVTT